MRPGHESKITFLGFELRIGSQEFSSIKSKKRVRFIPQSLISMFLDTLLIEVPMSPFPPITSIFVSFSVVGDLESPYTNYRIFADDLFP